MKNLTIFLLAVSFCAAAVAGQTRSAVKNSKTSKTAKSTVRAKTTSAKPSVAAPKKLKPPVPPVRPFGLPKLETEILAELNLLRGDPADYAKYLEAYLKTFDGKYFVNSDGLQLESSEGTKPVTEVIEILKLTKPLSRFTAAEGLARAAADHVADLARNEKTGHQGSNGSLPDARVALYGIAAAGVNENITYGVRNAREIVLTMLVDEGNPSRSHRKNLLEPNLKIVGLATGEIKPVGLACVLVLTPSFTERPK